MKTNPALFFALITVVSTVALHGAEANSVTNNPHAAKDLGMFENQDITAAVGPFLRSIREQRKPGEVRLLFVSLLRGEKPLVVVLKTWSETQLAAGVVLQEESELGSLSVHLTAEPTENAADAVRYVGRMALIKASTTSVLGLQLEGDVGAKLRPKHLFVTHFSGERTDRGAAMAAALVLARG